MCVIAQRYRAAVEYARPFLERHAHAWPLRYLIASIYVGLNETQAARRELSLVK